MELLIFFRKKKDQMVLFKAFQISNSLPGQGVLCIFLWLKDGKKNKQKKTLNYRRGLLTSLVDITKTLNL